MKRFPAAVATICFAVGGLAAAVTLTAQTYPPAKVSVSQDSDLYAVLPGGINSAQDYFASGLQLAGYVGSLPARANALIGGDATTNLFQRATTGSSVTTTVTYGGPDRWAYWSGTNTAMTVSRDSTAGDLIPGYKYAFKMARTAAQTGVVQMCMLQEIESANVYQFQGQTAELDFHAVTGANFSPTSGNITAYIITGTGTDEGVAGTSSVANGLNTGGGGSGSWTGQANATAAVISLGGAGTVGRYAAVASIPATATEMAVAICMTPTGTAGTNDYVALSGIQLVRNASLASKASATAGYSCPDNAINAQINCSAFDRSRSTAVEAALQQRYYYELDESATIFVAGACKAESVTVATCYVQFPVPMRAAPTMTYANGFATETTVAGGTLGACNTLATASTVASTASGPLGILVGCTATTVPAAGSAGMLYSNNGTGKIKASAEL